jgi:hypothetical protein
MRGALATVAALGGIALVVAACSSKGGATGGHPDAGGDASGHPDASGSDGSDGAASDATPFDAVTPIDGAGDDGDDGSAPSCGSATEAGVAAPGPEDWAQWPMPNSPVDVASGAPHAASYTDNGDGTVSDHVTGLMWQEVAEPTSTDFATALSTCASLNLGGHADWRLPRYVELVSLVDYSNSVPCIDTTAFPDAIPTDFWTSTVVATSTCNVWEVYFTAGDAGFDPIAGVVNAIRCVRTEVPPARVLVPPARYTVAAGTVLDVQTNLTWQQTPGPVTTGWAAAKSYCAALSLDGPGAWRLPTAKELVTLVDAVLPAPPAIDPTAFPGAAPLPFWSTTPIATQPTHPWGLDFSRGYIVDLDPASANAVRCVR